MAVLIKDEEADRLIRTLAQRTGETITDAVKTSVRERLARTPPSDAEVQSRKERIRQILAEFEAMPTLDDRSEDEILGYNEQGHFD